MPQSSARTPSMPERMRAASEDWRLGLTLAERLAAIGETLRPVPGASRRRRMHWRQQRRTDIARARKLAALIAVARILWGEVWGCYRANTSSAPADGFM